ncbi:MAG: hypothetical protein HYR62_02930 [Actinobacteria bacterium]|nr:hypothetical protein [Actinomycetota bacterium]MBI3687424.1 hypothetical protein [Actinomycetota bacterium]
MIIILDTDTHRPESRPSAAVPLLGAALTVPGRPVRLTELLAQVRDDGVAGGAYLAEVAAARTVVAAGDNPVLYHAWRDVLPPRAKQAQQHQVPGAAAWFADLVVYDGGMLPGGREFHRSLGHWNTPAQIEIFQCLSGRVLMLYTIGPTGMSTVDYQVCVAGDHVVIPPGGWHLTVVLDGPAAVFNVYTDADNLLAGGHTSRDAARAPNLKYRFMTAPPFTVVTTGREIGVESTSVDLSALSLSRRDAAPLWAAGLLEPAGLSVFYQHATDLDMALLQQQATQHGHTDNHPVTRHPARGGERPGRRRHPSWTGS